MHGYENSRVKRLFELIEERNINQKELADATGVARSSFTDWKSGKSIPSGERLIALANYFGVTAEYLLGIETPDVSEIDIKLNAEMQQLSDDQKKELLKYAKYLQIE